MSQKQEPISLKKPKCHGFVIIGTLLFIFACNQKHDSTKSFGIKEVKSISIPVENEISYQTNQFTGDSIKDIFNEKGEVIPTGRAIKIRPKKYFVEKLPKPEKNLFTGWQSIQKTSVSIYSEFKNEEINYLGKIYLDSIEKRDIDISNSAVGKSFIVNENSDTLILGVKIPIEIKRNNPAFPKVHTDIKHQIIDEIFPTIQHIGKDRQFKNMWINQISHLDSNNIWIGTEGFGLIIYNGNSFTQYNTQSGLASNSINVFAKDQNNKYWIGTWGDGLNYFDGQYFYSYGIKEGYSDKFIWDLLLAKDGKIWTCGRRSLSFIENDSIVHLDFKGAADISNPSEIHEDQNGKIWIGHLAGEISIYDNGKIRTIPKNKLPIKSRILKILNDSKGRVFIGTRGDGLFVIKNDSIIQYKTKGRTIENVINSISEDSQGNIWIGSLAGLLVMKDCQLLRFKEEIKSLNEAVTSLFLDPNDNVWIGSFESGLRFLKNSPFENVSTLQGLKSDTEIRSITEDENGNFYFTSTNGVYYYDGESIRLINQEHGLREPRLYNSFKDSKDNIWFAANSGGVIKFDGKSFTKYMQENGLCGNDVLSIYEDSKGLLWFGTFQDGVCSFNGEYFEHFTKSEGMISNDVESILEDKKGNIWFACYQGGLSKYDGESIIHYTEKEGLSDKTVWTFALDQNDNIWAGTGSGGISVFSGNEFHYINENHGLVSNQITSITVDDHSRVWVGTINGLNMLQLPDNDKVEPQNIFQYDEYDGMINSNFYTESRIIDSNKNIWWGTKKGVVRVNSESFQETKTINSPYLSLIKINDEHVNLRVLPSLYSDRIKTSNFEGVSIAPKDIALAHDLNHLRFHYSSLDWNSPNKVEYSYRVRGINDTWSNPNKESSLDLIDLKPGNYELQIRAKGENNIWSTPNSFKIKILPPWWLSHWAKGFYLCLGFGFIWMVMRIRTSSLKKNQKRLETKIKEATKEIHDQKAEIERNHEEMDRFKTNFFTNITHEFRTPLTVILGIADDLKNDNKAVELIRRNGTRLLNLINQILDLSKLETGKLEVSYKQQDVVKLTKYLIESFRSLLDSKNLKLNLKSNVDSLVMDVDEEKLQSLISNLLSNAIKFSANGVAIHIDLMQEENYFSISIRDEGQGIPENAMDHIFDRFYQVEGQKAQHIGSGVGLALCKEITKVLGGDISVKNHSEGGAEFSIRLPIRNNSSNYDNQFTELITQKSLSIDEGEEVVIEDIDITENDKPIVLIVEDEPDIRTFLTNNLKQEYAVISEENGQKGLKSALEKIPDIIISDVMMPVMDGLEFTNKIKSDIRTSHIPIVMLTAKVDIDSRLEGLKHGADVYLPKPFNKEELNLHLNNLLKLRASIQEKISKSEGKSESSIPEIENSFLKMLRETLHSHLEEDSFGVDKLCEEIGLSRMQVHRKLKALTGISTTEFINDFRLKEAMKLLVNPELNISEIAYSVGYSDPNYFSRLFTKMTGKSPSEFRETRIK